jgi:cytochrome c5
VRAFVLALLVAAVAACDVPTPLAPAEPIGEVPKWGEGFGTPQQFPAVAPMMGKLGNTGLPAGTKSPGDTGSWSGGDAALGKELYANLCASCHGAAGEGNKSIGAVAFDDPKWQSAIEDKTIARTVMLGKGAMPSFMSKGLDKPKLMGIVAYIRTLKPGDHGW